MNSASVFTSKNGLNIFKSFEIANNKNIGIYFIAFMIGRAALPGEFSPFGVAFFAAIIGMQVSPMIVFVSILAGMLSWSGSFGLIFSFIAKVVVFTLLTTLAIRTTNERKYLKMIILFFSVFIVNFFPILFRLFIFYDVLLAFFQSIVTVMVFILIKKGINLLLKGPTMQMVLPEHVWGLSFIGGLILMGIRNFNLFGIQLMIAAAIIIILFYAKIKGPGAGSAAGVMMGVIACSSGVGEISLIGSLALSGMLAGIFRKLGRIGMVLGFIAGNAILAYSVNGSILPILKGTDIIVSSLLFLIVSERTIDELRNYLNRGIAVNAIENKEVECTKTAANKLNAFSKAVEELAITFNKVPTPQQYYSGNDVFDFCDTMVDRVCKKCSLCPHCWERDFNDTYQGMFSLIEILEQKGSITLEDMPKSFSASSCIKSKQIMDTANTIFELYRVNFMWRKRIGESRGILSDHLKGFSKVISTLANEIIQQGENCIDMEAKVDQALRNHGFYPALVEIHGDESGSKNILIKFKECIGINYCHGELEKIISNALGRRVARKEGLCEHRQSCTLEYVSSQMFGVTVGAAKMSKNNNIVCGDNHTFMELQDKKYLLALSDGMGSGEAAANNSKVAIDLLEKFLETGFDRDTAVRMINSALVLKSSEDSYATMDISAIDLYTGRVEFIKIGAAYSYIKKVDRVEVIKAASLPAGIFEDIELQLTDRKLGHGDILVMVSDGVSESKWEEEGERDWLVDFLEKNSSSNPQELADSIIERAILNYGDLVADDMTVLVAKVWERF